MTKLEIPYIKTLFKHHIMISNVHLMMIYFVKSYYPKRKTTAYFHEVQFNTRF